MTYTVIIGSFYETFSENSQSIKFYGIFSENF